MFPRVIFDLPQDKEDFRYDELTRQARESLGREKSNLSEKTVDDVPFRALADVSTAFHDNLLPFAFTMQMHVLLGSIISKTSSRKCTTK